MPATRAAHAAVVQLDLAVEARRDVGVVGRDHEREAELLPERLDQVEHALAGVRVEVPGRLVAEQQLRALGERAGERDALGLTARELGRQASAFASRPTSAAARSASTAIGPSATAARAAKATFS